MTFPDEPNLRSVARALWGGTPYGKASVMVGAGFSRNAIPTASSLTKVKLFPGWGELTESMARELYGAPNDADLLNKALQSTSSTSGALRIADEYQAWKGRGKLDALLQKSIPDDKFKPGPLHNLLFKLPWSDVLTTNFDTLLERAATEEVDRRYFVVRSQQDIPISVKPRIVKLHGSFPDSKPFIITEDDFRTYDKNNPLMVNLVQQCFVENTCCLIGFSGDDPNFLRWTGWVRDILGPTHMEPIYLVGILNHTPARRALLERRYVRSIDLAPLFPEKGWPDADVRHKAATDWFLRALHHLRPAEFHDWPQTSAIEVISSLFQNSPDLPKQDDDSLKIEHEHPAHMNAPDDFAAQEIEQDYESLSDEEKVAESQRQLRERGRRNEGDFLNHKIDAVVAAWRHNRERFPGWLIVPWANRNALEGKTVAWIDAIAAAAPSVEATRALGWLYELQWRLEKCLLPWPDRLVLAVQHLLEGENLGRLSSDASSGDSAKALGVQLLRAYRERGHHESFERWLSTLTAVVETDREYRAFCTHQTALALLEEWQIDKATDVLMSWDVDGVEPMWRARKAALLGELDCNEAFGEAIQSLREIQAIGGPDCIAARTREASVLWLASVLAPWMSDDRRKLEARRFELRKKGLEANLFAERLSALVAGSPLSQSVALVRKKRAESTPVEASFLVRRYIEDAASLLRRPGVTADGPMVSDAVAWMALESPLAALRLSIRNREHGGNSELLSVTSLAQIQAEYSSPIFRGILETISALSVRLAKLSDEPQYERSDSVDDNRNSASGVNWLLQSALSHLVSMAPILTEEQLKDAVICCFDVRRKWKHGQWQTWDKIEGAVASLLSQCADGTIEELLSDIMDQPIAGLETTGSSPINAHDVVAQSAIRWPASHSCKSYAPQHRIAHLIEQLSKDVSLPVKSRIVMRVATACHWNPLDKDTPILLTSAIEKMLAEFDAKAGAQNIDYFLTLQDLLIVPDPEGGKLRSLIVTKLAKSEWNPQISRNSDGTVMSIQVGAGRNDPITLAAGLTSEPWVMTSWLLSAADWERQQVLDMLERAEAWLFSEGFELLERQHSDTSPMFGRYDDRALKIVEFCRKVVLPKSWNDREIATKAVNILSYLQKHQVVTLSAAGVFVAETPDSAEGSIADEMRKAAASLTTQYSYAFSIGLLAWMAETSREHLPAPPEDLVNEIAIAIRGRRSPDLLWAIQIADILLKQYAGLISDTFRRDVAVGLRYLATETDVNSPTLNISQQHGSLEEIRKYCVKLAATLKKYPEGVDVADIWIEKENSETVRAVKRAFRRLRD